MGGAVSSGRDNNELIDNLMGGKYIRSRDVERVFRALDRADYMTPESRDQAYKDLAWRNGQLHISAPCIYRSEENYRKKKSEAFFDSEDESVSEVMEGLELRPGLSFLNIGSGTGYLSTLAGLLLGSGGINHGVEVHAMVVDYANKKLAQFIENSPTVDEFDFCEPKFYHGNGLCLAPLQTPYDRVYCGACCPEEYQNYFKQLIKVGGILVMPLNDNLVQVRRVAAGEWSSRTLLNVSFATLVAPTPTGEQRAHPLRLDEQSPARLQALCRRAVRAALRGALLATDAALREPPPRAPPAKRACPRRICIPLDDQNEGEPDEGLNGLHDLDHTNGGAEMNALLSLVLRMGHNRVAGALRFDRLGSSSDSRASDGDSSDDDDDSIFAAPLLVFAGPNVRFDPPARSSDYSSNEGDYGDTDDDDDDEDDSPDDDAMAEADRPSRPSSGAASERRSAPRAAAADPRSIVYFEFEDRSARDRSPPTDPPAAPAPAPAGDADTGAAGSKGSKEDKVDEEEPRKSQDKASKKRSSKERSPKDRKQDKSARCSKEASPRSEGREGRAENPQVPAEVEIYLGKAREAAGTSAMEWDTAGEPKPQHSSDDETTESTSKAKEDKRQKFDSGIGEEYTPTSGSSGSERESSADERESSLAEDEGKAGRRRRQKRSFCARDSSSDSGSDGGRTRRGGPDARRVRLSILMKRAVRDLPLPYAMKIYLNYGRCFQV